MSTTKCSGCQRTVAEDAAVCPHCDEVLDPSLRAPEPRPSTNRAPRRVRTRPPVEEATNPGVAIDGVEAKPEPPPLSAPDEALDHLVVFWRRLHSADKLALSGCLTVIVSTFLPWKETARDGEILGLLTWGIINAGLAGLAIALLALRQDENRATVRLYWFGQMVSLALSLVGCLVALRLSWDTTPVAIGAGREAIATSTPSLGLLVGLLGNLLAGAGTWGAQRH